VSAMQTLQNIIPYDVPTGKVAKTILVAIRRMAIEGLADAHATNILISDFGLAYRRPMIFLRVMLAEISRIANRQIQIAPCCCSRMTDGEAALLLIVERARDEPHRARANLARLSGSLDCLPALSVAQALADALDDIGHPLRLTQSRDSLM
jgi:hypothetical protein